MLVVTSAGAAQIPLGPSISIGLGGGVAGRIGGSGNSNTDKQAGLAGMVAVDFPVAPLVTLGAEADYWRRTKVNALFGTGVLTVRLPATPFSLKAGGGYGRGDFGGGAVQTGGAGQLGFVYDFLGFGSNGARVFANAFVASGSPRNTLLADLGVALTWR